MGFERERLKKIYTNERGFTIVELLIVIVVIGILAAIVIVSYVGIQKQAVKTVLQSDLHNAGNSMQIAYLDGSGYPTVLPASVRSSPGVILSLASGGGDVYTGLSATQNGLLFYTICQKLVADGAGAKPDDNHDYVSSCAVYNKNQIHIEGWNGRDVNTPLTAAALQTYVSSYAGGQKALFTTNAGSFMNQLTAKFQAAGGTFPVTSFWDSWATSSNGGVMQPSLPAPTSSGSGDPESYCINATYPSSPSVKFYIRQYSTPTEGTCS